MTSNATTEIRTEYGVRLPDNTELWAGVGEHQTMQIPLVGGSYFLHPIRQNLSQDAGRDRRGMEVEYRRAMETLGFRTDVEGDGDVPLLTFIKRDIITLTLEAVTA